MKFCLMLFVVCLNGEDEIFIVFLDQLLGGYLAALGGGSDRSLSVSRARHSVSSWPRVVRKPLPAHVIMKRGPNCKLSLAADTPTFNF